MRITVHLNRFYDWEPVPDDVAVTDADLLAKRAKPALGGGYVMRVPKDAPDGGTHTTIMLPEAELCAEIVRAAIRDHRFDLTRSSAMAAYLSRETMPHHAHRKWIEDFDVENDDGPDEALLRARLKPHVDAGHVSAEDAEDIVTAYLQPLDSDAHVEHLHDHFGTKKVAP